MAEETQTEPKKVAIYRWDANGNFSSSDVVYEGYQLKDNETFDPVPQGSRQPVHRIAGGWQEGTKEEQEAYEKAMNERFAKLRPDLVQSNEPSTQDKAINALGLQIAQIQKTQATTAQAINALGLQLAAKQANDQQADK